MAQTHVSSDITHGVPEADLTIEQFHERYDRQPGFEYWFGKAIRKPTPDWMHGTLQILVGNLLFELGYFTASETSLRIDPEWEPRPDVCALLNLEGRYPNRPVEIVMEILSPGERDIEQKCARYDRIGVLQIFVFDPGVRAIYEWNRTEKRLQPITTLIFGNGRSVKADTIWLDLERRNPASR